MRWQIAVRLVLLTSAALLSTLVGLRFAGELARGWVGPVAMLLAGLLYVGLLTFGDAAGWNVAILLGLGVACGAAISAVPGVQQRQASDLLPLLSAMMLLVLAWVSGRGFREAFSWLGRILWIGALGYWLGLVLLALTGADDLLRLTWLAAGLALFTGLAGGWFARMGPDEFHPDEVRRAGELYLLGLNLWVTAALLLG